MSSSAHGVSLSFCYLQRVLELVPESDVARDIARGLEAHVVRCTQTLLRNARKACINTATKVDAVVLIHKVSTYTKLKALEGILLIEILINVLARELSRKTVSKVRTSIEEDAVLLCDRSQAEGEI